MERAHAKHVGQRQSSVTAGEGRSDGTEAISRRPLERLCSPFLSWFQLPVTFLAKHNKIRIRRGPACLSGRYWLRAKVAVLVVPAALLKLEEVLAPGRTVKFDLCHMAAGNWIPPLTPAALQGGSELRARGRPVGHEYDRSVAPRKDMVLQAMLRIVVERSLTGAHGEHQGERLPLETQAETRRQRQELLAVPTQDVSRQFASQAGF